MPESRPLARDPFQYFEFEPHTDIPDHSSPGRPARGNKFGLLVIAAFTCTTVLTAVIAIMEIFSPVGDLGLRVDGSGIVAAVAAGSPAARADIVAGDIVVPVAGRRRDWLIAEGIIAPAPNEKVHLSLARGLRDVTADLTAQTLRYKAAWNIAVFFGLLSQLLTFGIAALLAAKRPALMTWGFFAFSIGSAIGSLPPGSPAFLGPLWELYLSTCFAAGMSGMLVFLSCFPYERAYGWRIWVISASFLLGASLLLLFPSGFLAGTFLRGLPLQAWQTTLGSQVVTDVIYAVGAGAFLTTYLGATSADRQRIAWVFYAITISLLGLLAQLASFSTKRFEIQLLVVAASNVLLIPLPLAVAYAVLHHRVFDIRFAASRTVVLTIVSGMLVVLFTILQWAIDTSLAHGNAFDITFDLLAAVGIGFWLKSANESVARFVDIVLFRRRHEAAEALRRAARALMESPEHVEDVDQALVTEPLQSYGLTTAALFRKTGEDGRLLRLCSIGWPEKSMDMIPSTSRISFHLRGERAPLTVGDLLSRNALPSGEGAPVLAVPVFVRRKLEAVALYGPHIAGGTLDPDEMDALKKLAVAAGKAYEDLQYVEYESTIERLKRALPNN